MDSDIIRPATEESTPFTREHVSINIRHEDAALASSIKEKMEDITTSSSISIVPETLRKGDERPYAPEKLSIGPLHRHNPSLAPAQPHKWRYLHSQLARAPETLEKSLEKRVDALRRHEHRARVCYAQRVEMSSDEFVQMLLLDGTFLVEVLLRYSFKALRRRGDPIFGREGMLFDLRCDMVLLENQVPLFVVQMLFSMAAARPGPCGSVTLAEAAFRFFRNMLQGGHGKGVLHDKFSEEGNHLLDLVYHSFLPTRLVRERPNKEGGSARGVGGGVDCVTKLLQRGIKLKKANTADSLLDIKFSDGVLEIPPLKIHRYTESLLSNAIAYEHCYKESTHYVTSYALLMHTLLASDRDSNLLSKLNILTTSEGVELLGASGMFRKLREGTAVKSFYYEALCEQVNGYKRSNWGDGLLQKIQTNRTGRPFSNVVLIVAVAVLFLTFVGTFFTVLSFSIHR